MSLQQGILPRSVSNGFGRRRAKVDFGPKSEGKLPHVKQNSNLLTSAGQGGGCSREFLVFLATSLVGLNVEVQVLDGSVFSGIFHAADAKKDFGIILKMACLVKDCSRKQKGTSDMVIGPPIKTMIIPAKELVQIISKDLPVTRSGLVGELQRDRQQEILIDSSISKSRFVDSVRELERWVPDDDDPGCPELENIFDRHWNRGWDQFEVNESLYGVKSTFVEELYTTKLDKGPQMKEREREAIRIAKEIEGETTYDLHLAEERGMIFNDNLEIDEETRFSSVFRGVDDSGYDDSDDILLDAQNDKTFEGGYNSAVDKSNAEFSSWRPTNGALASLRPYVGAEHSSQSTSGKDMHEYGPGSDDHVRPLSSGHASKNALHLGNKMIVKPCENQFTEHSINNHSEGVGHVLSEGVQSSKPDESQSQLWPKKEGSDKIGLSASATAYAPSSAFSKGRETASTSSSDLSEGTKSSSKGQVASQSVISHVRPSSSASSTSEFGNVPTASRLLTPSSSVGSLTSEKSTLNPNAKEFKLNPNAKSFRPSQTQQLRPASPVSDGSFFYQGNVGPATLMTSLPMGIGIGPSYAPTPPNVFIQPYGPPLPSQPYFHPNGPQLQYGQQHMITGHPRQVFYMPTYPPDMHYRGRDF